MYSKIIDAYIREHKSNYKAKYSYHSCDRIDALSYKFHYYVRDPQLLQMNIFLEIRLGDKIEVYVKEAIHEHEQWALACDALERIRKYTNRKTTIAPIDMPMFIQEKQIKANVSPQDMINTLNYIKYHDGKNPDSIYAFYEIFLNYLNKRLEAKKYKEALSACNMLFEDIFYETIWYGFNIKYLDQEYLMHQAYIRSIINMIQSRFIEIEQKEPDLLVDFMLQIFQHWRFAFAIYSSLEKLAIEYPQQMLSLLTKMKDSCTTSSLDGCKIVFDIIMALIDKDEKAHRHNIIEVLKLIMTDILSFANPEEQRETGIIFLKMVGFDLLIEIFDETKDSHVYSCFKIEDIPIDFHPYIQQQLKDSLQYYVEMMKDQTRRMEAIAQIANINTLLIEYFNIY